MGCLVPELKLRMDAPSDLLRLVAATVKSSRLNDVEEADSNKLNLSSTPSPSSTPSSMTSSVISSGAQVVYDQVLASVNEIAPSLDPKYSPLVDLLTSGLGKLRNSFIAFLHEVYDMCVMSRLENFNNENRNFWYNNKQPTYGDKQWLIPSHSTYFPLPSCSYYQTKSYLCVYNNVLKDLCLELSIYLTRGVKSVSCFDSSNNEVFRLCLFASDGRC